MIVNLFIFLIALITQPLLLCFAGDILIQFRNELEVIIFHSSWYNQTMKYKKTLKQFLMRFNKPMRLTFGHVIELNMETFVTVKKFN